MFRVTLKRMYILLIWDERLYIYQDGYIYIYIYNLFIYLMVASLSLWFPVQLAPYYLRRLLPHASPLSQPRLACVVCRLAVGPLRLPDCLSLSLLPVC